MAGRSRKGINGFEQREFSDVGGNERMNEGDPGDERLKEKCSGSE